MLYSGHALRQDPTSSTEEAGPSSFIRAKASGVQGDEGGQCCPRSAGGKDKRMKRTENRMTESKGSDQNRRAMMRKAIQVAWPAMAESFFVTLAGMIDTMMVSSLGSYAVAAVGLTTQPKFIGLTLFFGVNVAVSALVARRKGEQNRENANEILLTAFALTMVLCVIITAASVAFAPQMMRLAGSNADTHDAAVEYFRIIMGGMFFNVLTMVINAAQRGSGNTRLSMTTNLTSSIVNVAFNYLLIGGNLGFPALGIRGAAIATVLGTVVAAGMAVFSLFRGSSYVQIPEMIRKKLRCTKNSAIAVWHMAYHTSLENIAMRVGFLATALLAARLGTDEFAAHNIGMNLLGLGFSFADGINIIAGLFVLDDGVAVLVVQPVMKFVARDEAMQCVAIGLYHGSRHIGKVGGLGHQS